MTTVAVSLGFGRVALVAEFKKLDVTALERTLICYPMEFGVFINLLFLLNYNLQFWAVQSYLRPGMIRYLVQFTTA